MQSENHTDGYNRSIKFMDFVKATIITIMILHVMRCILIKG